MTNRFKVWIGGLVVGFLAGSIVGATIYATLLLNIIK